MESPSSNSITAPEHKFRFGTGYVDEASGIRFVGYHPTLFPEEWHRYLDGAEGVYQSRGVSDSLARRQLEDGRGVSLFFIGYNKEGDAVAGIRFRGPIGSSVDSSILREMALSPDIAIIRDALDRACVAGALEMKGMWSKGAGINGVHLASSLIRTCLVAMEWLGTDYTFATAAARLSALVEYTGSVVISDVPVPYPDERYGTVLFSFERIASPQLCAPEHLAAFESDIAQLSTAAKANGLATNYATSRALVLDPQNRGEAAVLEVLRADPYTKVIDHLESQKEQLAGLVGVPEAILAESPRWAYYPWLHTLVSVLGPRGYVELRLDRNRNKITRGEQHTLRSQRIGVVGASAGHVIAHTLAMEGLVGELRLADFDTLELSNLNRIPARVLDLGTNKTVVSARRIAEIDPYVKVHIFPEGITKENMEEFLTGLDLVVEECDSLDIKFAVREAARSHGIPVIMETSDRGVLDVERFDLEPERPLLHGRLGSITSKDLEGLSMAERGPYVAKMVGPAEASARGVASLLELGMSVSGWPQLGSEVTLGAASVAASVRRLVTGGELRSGRVRIDLEEQLDLIGDGGYNDEKTAWLASTPPVDPEPESDDPITLIVDAARRAPSGGNVQPWRFEASDSEVRFYIVPERSNSAMDIQMRGSYVGIGAALFNARVRAAKLGLLGGTEILSEGIYSPLVATLHLGESRDPDLAPLSEYVSARTTNRRPGHREEISANTAEDLVRVTGREGGKLRLITDQPSLATAGTLIGEADRRRFLLGKVYHEMMAELRWPVRDQLVDGLDVRTLELGPAGYAAFDLLGRPDVMSELSQWREGRALGMNTKMTITTASALAVITVPRGGPAEYVRGGQALERFWIEANKLGLSLQPCAPVFLYATSDADLLGLGGERNVDELARQQAQFAEFLGLDGTEALVMVLRVFSSEPPSVRSIRRPLDEVLTRL